MNDLEIYRFLKYVEECRWKKIFDIWKLYWKYKVTKNQKWYNKFFILEKYCKKNNLLKSNFKSIPFQDYEVSDYWKEFIYKYSKRINRWHFRAKYYSPFLSIVAIIISIIALFK